MSQSTNLPDKVREGGFTDGEQINSLVDVVGLPVRAFLVVPDARRVTG